MGEWRDHERWAILAEEFNPSAPGGLYCDIQEFLTMKAAASGRRPVEFRTFFLEVFSHVLEKEDNVARSEQAEANSIRRSLSLANEEDRERLVALLIRTNERQSGSS